MLEKSKSLVEAKLSTLKDKLQATVAEKKPKRKRAKRSLRSKKVYKSLTSKK